MDIHEYQAKELLKKYSIPIQKYWVISSIEELKACMKQEQIQSAVLKIQIHAGGRGKAGGVIIAHSPENILAEAQKLLGRTFVNEQTGPRGLVASKLILSAPVKIRTEYYLAVSINRKLGCAILVASPVGGGDIEQVAKRSPEKILTLPVPFEGSFRPYHLIEIAKFMGWKDHEALVGSEIVQNIIRLFMETDALLVEINPLIETEAGELLALDAKITLDDNALYRHPDLQAYYDPSQLLPAEVEARKNELAYVGLQGNIGCIVNGAGLAMATMDLIKYAGGNPANFLDVGGGASKEKVAMGLKIVLSDPNVRAVLVNIFGGIMNCETLAEGLIAASHEKDIRVPIVIRMEGTNVEQGKDLLRKSGLQFEFAKDLSEAAKKVVAAIQEQ